MAFTNVKEIHYNDRDYYLPKIWVDNGAYGVPETTYQQMPKTNLYITSNIYRNCSRIPTGYSCTGYINILKGVTIQAEWSNLTFTSNSIWYVYQSEGRWIISATLPSTIPTTYYMMTINANNYVIIQENNSGNQSWYNNEIFIVRIPTSDTDLLWFLDCTAIQSWLTNTFNTYKVNNKTVAHWDNDANGGIILKNSTLLNNFNLSNDYLIWPRYMAYDETEPLPYVEPAQRAIFVGSEIRDAMIPEAVKIQAQPLNAASIDYTAITQTTVPGLVDFIPGCPVNIQVGSNTEPTYSVWPCELTHNTPVTNGYEIATNYAPSFQLVNGKTADNFVTIQVHATNSSINVNVTDWCDSTSTTTTIRAAADQFVVPTVNYFTARLPATFTLGSAWTEDPVGSSTTSMMVTGHSTWYGCYNATTEWSTSQFNTPKNILVAGDLWGIDNNNNYWYVDNTSSASATQYVLESFDPAQNNLCVYTKNKTTPMALLQSMSWSSASDWTSIADDTLWGNQPCRIGRHDTYRWSPIVGHSFIPTAPSPIYIENLSFQTTKALLATGSTMLRQFSCQLKVDDTLNSGGTATVYVGNGYYIPADLPYMPNAIYTNGQIGTSWHGYKYSGSLTQHSLTSTYQHAYHATQSTVNVTSSGLQPARNFSPNQPLYFTVIVEPNQYRTATSISVDNGSFDSNNHTITYTLPSGLLQLNIVNLYGTWSVDTSSMDPYMRTHDFTNITLSAVGDSIITHPLDYGASYEIKWATNTTLTIKSVSTDVNITAYRSSSCRLSNENIIGNNINCTKTIYWFRTTDNISANTTYTNPNCTTPSYSDWVDSTGSAMGPLLIHTFSNI